MHHLPIDLGWSANHNGDFSGDVSINRPDGSSFSVPYFVLEAIVAQKVRSDRINNLEQAEPRDLLK